MPRSSSSLFLPVVECILLNAIAYPALTSFMEQTAQSDFSPLLRSVMLSQLILAILSMLGHLVMAAIDRSSYIIPSASILTDKGRDQGTEWKILQILSQRKSYKYAMGVSNIYCTCVMGLLILQATVLSQAYSGSGLLTVTEQRQNPVSSYVYKSSERHDWIQAALGSSGWVKQVGWSFQIRAHDAFTEVLNSQTLVCLRQSSSKPWYIIKILSVCNHQQLIQS